MNNNYNIENSSSIQEEDEVDVKVLVNKFLSLWPWALISCVILVILAGLYLHFSTPSYHVNASVLIKEANGGLPGSGSSADASLLESMGIMTGPSNVNNEIQVFKSYPLIREVVKKEQLNVHYYTEDGLKTIELNKKNVPFQAIFLSFQEDSLKKKGSINYQLDIKKDRTGFQIKSEETGEDITASWYDTLTLASGKVAFIPNSSFIGKEKELYSLKVGSSESAVNALFASLNLSIEDKQASIINLNLVAHLPQSGEEELNALIQAYMDANVKANNRIADSTIAFIDRRLVIVSRQLSDVEKQIQKFKQKNKIADLSSQSQALIQSTKEYSQEISEKEVRLSVIKSLQDYLERNKNNPRIVPASLMIENTTLSGIISQYNELLLQRSQLLVNATGDNPRVKNLDQQIANLRGDLVHGIASVKQSAETALKSVKGQLNSLQGKITTVPEKERTFLDYSRKQEVRQQLYLFLLKKREETAISKSSSIANARIINAARADQSPFSPRKKIILLAALILGGLIPFGYTYLRDLINTKITSRKDIENETDLPIVGEIGHKKKEGRVVVGNHSRTVISEQFRSLRTNLQFLLSDQERKTILATSSMGGEGKSFISLNLAMSLAITGKKVVLMELDLRKPKIAAPLGIRVTNGFSGYVIGQAEKESIVYDSGLHENLKIIPAGAVPPNPVELLLHERTQTMMTYLKKEFDYIFIDAPPMLVTDAQIMSQYADTTLYVIRVGETHKDQIRIPENLRRTGKMSNLNLVVNDIQQKKYSGGYYGYGKGYGGYGYGYGDYIDDQEEGKSWKFWKR